MDEKCVQVKTQIIFLIIFGIAMGFLKAAVLVYLNMH